VSDDWEKFGEVHVRYVRDYRQLWVEEGYYQSDGWGSVDFHGLREISTYDQVDAVLDDARHLVGKSRDLHIGSIWIPASEVERFADWLAVEIDPVGEAMKVVAELSGAPSDYWEV
jgi:hypothetical protein